LEDDFEDYNFYCSGYDYGYAGYVFYLEVAGYNFNYGRYNFSGYEYAGYVLAFG